MGFSTALKRAVLVAGDVAALVLALLVSIVLRYPDRSFVEPLQLLEIHFVPFGALFLLWLLVFYIYNLYELRFLENSIAFFSLAAQAFVVNALLAVVFFYFNPFVGISPRTVLFVDMGLSALLFGAWRTFFNRAIAQKLTEHIALAGTSSSMLELARTVVQNPTYGYRISCFIAPTRTNLPEDLLHLPIFTTDELQKLAASKSEKLADTNLVVLEHSPALTPAQTLAFFSLLSRKISFLTLPSFIERVFQKIPLSEVSESWFLENLSEGEKRFYETLKRALDIAGAVVLGIITLPLVVLVALGIKLEDGRRALYYQTRIGKNGRVFLLVKLQSMVEDAEAQGPRWTKDQDPRVTRFGAFLRSARLDELPQLWNVLKGDLSFIGPRPERPEFVLKLNQNIPFYELRHLVRPGLSGWAQINNPLHSVEESYEKLEYDLFYIKNRSLALDTAIALKTLNIILRRKGR